MVILMQKTLSTREIYLPRWETKRTDAIGVEVINMT
jgi:hypothetical protein